MHRIVISRKSILRGLLGVYLFPLWLVVFSLSVPPADFPLCVMMFVLAVLGLTLARKENRAWRAIWTVGVVIAIVAGVLQIVAGRRVAARLHSEKQSARYSEAGNTP